MPLNMLNVIIPMAGKSIFFPPDEFYYPKPLIDIGGKPMIELVVRSIARIQRKKQFMFVINEDDAKRFHLDRILRLLVGKDSVVAEQPRDSLGALPSCLMLVDHIDPDTPLLISNSDQLVDVDYDELLQTFEGQHADGGVATFYSVHPQWSYVAVDETGAVVEAAEKKPISDSAIAGLYYFAKGKYFVEAAKASILKDAKVNGRFYISAALNEMILRGMKIVPYRLSGAAYHSFYSPEMVQAYKAAAQAHPQ